MSVSVLVGLQWGDEGKGKIIDLLGEEYSHVVRGQGGHNAGHTVIVEDKEYNFHLLPSAILHTNTKCYIGAGVVVYPRQLINELKELDFDPEGRFFISPFAHVILPRHIAQDQNQEEMRKSQQLGTTGRGIGPSYAEKVARCGLKISELLNADFAKDFFDSDSNYSLYFDDLKKLEKYIAPVEQMLFEAEKKGEKILLEGAQGTLLDIQFGTYPFVTSSNTTAAGLCSGAGIGPSKVKSTFGILKAYQTRVGNGPFPTELLEKDLTLFPSSSDSREIGTTTGRIRRIGWLDLVAARFAIQINGVDALYLMKLDVLSGIDELKVCTAYSVEGIDVDFFIFKRHDFDHLSPKYHILKGWKEDISTVREFSKLPKEAKDYVMFIQEYLSVPIIAISVGPERSQIITLEK